MTETLPHTPPDDELKARLRTLLPQHDLDSPPWPLLLQHGELYDASPPGHVFTTGMPCEHFLILLSGCIRVQYHNPQGNEIVLYRVHPAETCTLTASCLLGHSDYPAEGIVEEALRAVLIPKAVFQQAMAVATFRDFVFTTMSSRIIDLMLLVNELAFRRMDKRLASLLLKYDTVIEKTHQALAVELGTAREVISRLLKDFESRGWISLGRGRIAVLDPGALQRHQRD